MRETTFATLACFTLLSGLAMAHLDEELPEWPANENPAIHQKGGTTFFHCSEVPERCKPDIGVTCTASPGGVSCPAGAAGSARVLMERPFGQCLPEGTVCVTFDAYYCAYIEVFAGTACVGSPCGTVWIVRVGACQP